MFPSTTDLRSLEKETLTRIGQIGPFAKLGDIQRQAREAAARIHKERGGIDVHLGFTLDIRLRDKGRAHSMPRRIDVGALVRVSQEDHRLIVGASYGLLVCSGVDPRTNPVVRKIHFDYEPFARRNAVEPKPSVHMQVCGKLSPHHHKAGYPVTCLDALYPHWEKPRIPLPPTCLAILLNWLMLEFRSDTTALSILKDPTWSSLVTRAERTVLLPYFAAASEFLGSTKNEKKSFFQRHLYEEDRDAESEDRDRKTR